MYGNRKRYVKYRVKPIGIDIEWKPRLGLVLELDEYYVVLPRLGYMLEKHGSCLLFFAIIVTLIVYSIRLDNPEHGANDR